MQRPHPTLARFSHQIFEHPIAVECSSRLGAACRPQKAG